MRIELTNISKKFGKIEIIKNFSAVFEDGKTYQIAGDSGSGKTTLLHIIMGLVKPDSGRVSPEGIRFSAVFQEDRLLENLSAIDNLRAVGIDGDIRSELKKLLPGEELDKRVSEFSGGMRRRVCIARALLAESDVIILDEPFSGLDTKNINNVVEYIMAQKKDRILIITSHTKISEDFCKDSSVIYL